MFPRLVAEWRWVLSHSWALRFVFLAFLLSVAEVFLPLALKSPSTPLQAFGFAVAISLTTGAAFVARLVAQKRSGVPSDGE